MSAEFAAAGRLVQTEYAQLQQGKLKLNFYAPSTIYGNPETVGYIASNAVFSFGANAVECSYIIGTLGARNKFAAGTLTLTRTN